MFTFTLQQKAQFEEEGWVAIPDFWSQHEILAMRAELERFGAIGLLHNVVPGGHGDAEVKVNLQLCPMSPHSRLFRAMPFAPKVTQAVSQLIGDPVFLQLDQVFVKPAKHGAGTNWHQDNAYFTLQNPLAGTALWTAVHDANAQNGTMRVIPHSFRALLEHSRDPQSNHHIRCYPDESRAVTVELPAGGALFFAYGTAHATGANTTNSDRAGIALHFINGERAQGMSGGVLERMPILSGPNATGGEREYNERVAGSWEREVDSALSKQTVNA